MKIILFIDKWDAGGIETYLLSNLERIKSETLKFTIVTSKKLTTVYDYRLKNLNIEIVELLDKEYSPLIRNFVLVRAFKEYIKQVNADIIHFHIYNAVSMIYCFLARKKIDIRILHSHNSDIEPGNLRKLKVAVHKMSRFIFLKYATHRWACSDLAGTWLYNNLDFEYKKNGIIIENFTFSSEKRTDFKLENNINDKIILGTIGRMNSQKNQMFLLRLMKMFKENKLPYYLFIVGSGPLQQELREYIEQNDLDNVVLYGLTDDVQKFLSGIDLFLLPSFFEGNPVSAIEAQASGVKTILSDSISKYAHILPSTKEANINELTTWYEIVKNAQLNTIEFRNQASEIVRKSGYSVVDTAAGLEQSYSYLGREK